MSNQEFLKWSGKTYRPTTSVPDSGVTEVWEQCTPDEYSLMDGRKKGFILFDDGKYHMARTVNKLN